MAKKKTTGEALLFSLIHFKEKITEEEFYRRYSFVKIESDRTAGKVKKTDFVEFEKSMI